MASSSASRSYGLGFGVRVVVGLVVVQFAFVGLLLGLFHSAKPRGLPVAIVGSGPLVTGIAQQLDKSGVFATQIAPNGPAARTLIDKRKVYGAYAPRAKSGLFDVASAASLPVVGVLQQTFMTVDAARKVPTVVKDLKPLPNDDNGGASGYLMVLVAAALAMIASWHLELRLPSIRSGLGAVLRRLVLLAVFALISAAVITFLATQDGVFKGDYVEVAGTIALLAFGVATVSSVTTSLLGGPAGFILPLAMFIVIGILAASGATSAPEFLPDFWRVLGQNLPPAAAIGVIRSTVYFGGGAITNPLTVLGVYAGGGAVLMLVIAPFRKLLP